MKLDCEPGYITLVWTENRAQADTSLFRLGTCSPTSFSPREAVFRVDVNDCNFSRLVCVCVCDASNSEVCGGLCRLSTVCVTHRLLVVSWSTPMSWFICPWISPRLCPSVSLLSAPTRGGCSSCSCEPLVSPTDSCLECAWSVPLYRPKDWYPRVYDPVFDTFGQADLVFHMAIMNGG